MMESYRDCAKRRKVKRRRHRIHEFIVNLIEVLGIVLGMVLSITAMHFILKLVWIVYAVYKIN